jgi:hypothetical protein
MKNRFQGLGYVSENIPMKGRKPKKAEKGVKAHNDIQVPVHSKVQCAIFTP